MDNQEKPKDYSENPQEIINESFDIIDNLVDFDKIPEAYRPIVRRVIHATGDTDYADNLIISPTAVDAAIKAIGAGKSIVTDVNMVKAGISAKGIARFGFRHIVTNESYEILISGEKPQVVETVPGWTHDITNIGEEEMLVMLWANEIFDKELPDTKSAKV